MHLKEDFSLGRLAAPFWTIQTAKIRWRRVVIPGGGKSKYQLQPIPPQKSLHVRDKNIFN